MRAYFYKKKVNLFGNQKVSSYICKNYQEKSLMCKYEEIEGWRLSNGKTIREIKSVTEPLALWFGLYFKDLFDNLK